MTEPLPARLVAEVSLPSGEPAAIRPLRREDAAAFGTYLEALSDATRSFWGPHAFTHEAAQAICGGLETDPVLRFVAVGNDDDRIVAYFLLHQGVRESDGTRYAELGIRLNEETCAALAPSVADAYQNAGVGGTMMRHILSVARRLGRTQIVLWDGVQARNERGVHFYARHGFRRVGEFTNSVLNYDMMLELQAEP